MMGKPSWSKFCGAARGTVVSADVTASGGGGQPRAASANQPAHVCNLHAAQTRHCNSLSTLVALGTHGLGRVSYSRAEGVPCAETRKLPTAAYPND